MLNEDYYWETDEPHSDNTVTMCDFLNNHLGSYFEIVEQDGSVAILRGRAGEKCSIQAIGNGDFTHHKVVWCKF